MADCLGGPAAEIQRNRSAVVGHSISDVRVSLADGGSARAAVRFDRPAGAAWPPFSEVEALLTAVQLAEAYLTHAHALDRPRRRRMWLRRCSVAALPAPSGAGRDHDPAATEAYGVEACGVEACAVEACAVPVRHWAERGTLNGHVSVFDCRVGPVAVECEIEHDVAQPPVARPPGAAPAHYRTVADVLGAGEGRYHATGYRFRRQRITDLVVDLDNRYVEALVRVAATAAAGLTGDGLGGHYEPALSMVDCMLSLTELGRVVVAGMLGPEGARSAPVSLAAVSLESRTPYQPMLNSFTVALAATRAGRPEGAAEGWRSFQLSGQFQGIHARATVAYGPPDQALAGRSHPELVAGGAGEREAV